MDDDNEWYDDCDGDEYEEPIGACDACDCDLYEDDCYIVDGDELCGQCYWWRTMA